MMLSVRYKPFLEAFKPRCSGELVACCWDLLHLIFYRERASQPGERGIEEPEAWLWCRQRQASRNNSGDSAGVRVMPVTSATRETAQPAEAAETVAPSQTG